jgi:hypothetical protein
MALADDVLQRLVYSTEPVLLLFGDTEESLGLARIAAERAGCRIAGDALTQDGPARFDAQIGASAALLVAAAPSAGFHSLLEKIGLAARRGRMNGVVAAPSAMIDLIAAADLPAEVDFLVDPDEDELEAALARATEPVSPRLHDVGRRNGVAVLQQLSEEAARIASVLASLSEDEGGGEDKAEPEAADAGFVRSIIRARRLRDQFFRGELFADPAFDMLLDLYAARLEGTRVAVSSLCIAAAVPATTALRWIRALTDRGLFVRSADPQDGRRVYIGLSDEAARAMARYLNALQRSGLPAV